MKTQPATPRIVKRVRSLFVIAVLIPLALGAWFSYRQVELALIQQSYDRSFSAARFHGTIVLDRLIEAELLLQEMQSVEDIRSGRLGAVVDHSRIAPRPARMEPSKTAISVNPLTAEVVLSGLFTGDALAGQYYRVGLNHEALFGLEEDHLVSAQFCVLEGELIVYCTTGLKPETESILAMLMFQSGQPRTTWPSTTGSLFYATSRQLFLPSHFDSASWTVVVAESDDIVFAPISQFRWMFPALTALALCVLLFLVLNQTRRQLGPIAALQSHARKVGSGEFETRLELRTNDEFTVLADSFNGMAKQLGDQFAFLKAMSEIDSALLESTQLATLCDAILCRVTLLLPVDSAAIVAIDELGAGTPVLYSLCRGQSSTGDAQSLPLTVLQLEELLDDFGEGSVTDESLDGEPLASYVGGDGDLQVCPLRFEGRTLGALLLRFPGRVPYGDETRERVRAFKDRLTVALSAIERQRKLYTQAHFDHLTGLPNRMLFLDRLEQYFAQAARQGSKVAVIYADLDKFKLVNDTLGHEQGDALLQETAARFSSLVRGSDTVARLAGDEFAIALPSIAQELDVLKVLRTVEREFSRPFEIAGQEFHLKASMGIALYPDNGETAEEVLKNADIAMFRVKSNPAQSYLFYEERMNYELQERTLMAQDLKRALDDGSFSLAYQPKVDAATHTIQSVEALIRWKHPEQGWISPARFIPIAEEAGLITDIGRFALNAACQALAHWQSLGLPIGQVAVNVSPRQIQYTNLVRDVEDALASARLAPECLELEITENLLIEDYQKTEAVLRQLKGVGVGLALDDFGTGYSSLSHIHELSFDTLKIDKCFVDHIGDSESSDAIVRSIVALGKTLDKKLVAEGVEDEAQLAFLTDAGCQVLQGYYFSKPLTGEALASLARLGQKLPVAGARAMERDTALVVEPI